MNKLNSGMVSLILKIQQATEQHPFVTILGFMCFLGYSHWRISSIAAKLICHPLQTVWHASIVGEKLARCWFSSLCPYCLKHMIAKKTPPQAPKLYKTFILNKNLFKTLQAVISSSTKKPKAENTLRNHDSYPGAKGCCYACAVH